MAKSNRTVTLTVNNSSSSVTSNDLQDDFQAFQMRSVIRDFRLAAELFASNGDTVFICGKGTQDKQGMLLVSYDIPSTASASVSGIRLLKVVKLAKRTITQLETIPAMKIALLLGDNVVSILDIDSLAELTSVPNNSAIIFATSSDSTSAASTPTGPVPLTVSKSASSLTAASPNELRICIATKRRALSFYRYFPQQKRVEEDKNLRGFELLDAPRALAFSRDRVCIGYKKSYVIMSLSTGMIINELVFTMNHDPVINCLQDRSQWCIQMEASTIFLNSYFEPLYENGIVWKDIPSAIVQASPYVLALMNQSIDVCTFNGSQSVPVQQIPHKGPSTAGKCRLWMDARTERIYAATPTDVVLLEPIPVHIQLVNYTGMYKYDLALILLRAVLGLSVSSSTQDHPRTNEGHAKGNLDTSAMSKESTFANNEPIAIKTSSESTGSRTGGMLDSSRQASMNDSSRSNQMNESTLWLEYYRVGTMYAFQLFHKQQFEQAFAEFNEFLTDPAEIISLFAPLTANTWLPNSHHALTEYVKQHRHFAEPNDFVGVKLENALHELQRYLTESRRVFQTVFRRSPDMWLEVQSLVQNCLILKPVRDLLTIVETALLKAYLYDNNNTLANALLRNHENSCLPSEVEKELKKHNRRAELVSFYERRERHEEALQLIINTESLASNDTILSYLANLNDVHLPLIFKYVQPIIKTAFEGQKDDDLIHDILILFIGEPTPTSPSVMDTPGQRSIKLDPVAVYDFLKKANQDFAVRYLEQICFRPELGPKQRDIHNKLVYAYCDRLKQLSDELKRSIRDKQADTYQDADLIASQPSMNNDKDKYSSVSPINKQKTEYESKLKLFLLNVNCQCDFDRLEAYFIQEQKNKAYEHLFSSHHAIVLGRLNKHQEALETFLRNGYFTDAETYCETIYLNGNIPLARELYRKLIEHYLKQSNDGNLNENSLKTILRIVNNVAERLDPVQTLEILPGELKLNKMTDFIENSLQTGSTNKRGSQLERNLLFLKLLRTQSNRIASENRSFTIDSDTKCARKECTSRFSATQAVVRFPDNQIVHLHCRAKYEMEREKSNKKRY